MTQTNLDFLSILQEYRQQVSPIVLKYVEDSLNFPNYCRVDSRYQTEIDFQKTLISDYPLRFGKYLRPSLLISTALSMGAKLSDTLLAAAAMQLSEEWILIHDDIQDNSEVRRGSPTLHRTYGIPLAINAGDALHVIMWKIISDINNQKISNEFYQLLNRTTFGQTVDINWTEQNKTNITDDDVYLILESKTCYYTISGPMRLGAILSNATEQQLNIIYQFGINLGRAFQIIDDVLDLTSDFSGLKKQQYNDIYEGKRTIVLSHLFRSVNPIELQELSAIFSLNRSQKTETQVFRVVELIKKYHSIEFAITQAKEFAQEAHRILDTRMDFIFQQPYRNQLVTAIDFIINRNH